MVVGIARCDETRAADTLSLGQAPLAATSSTVIVITQSSDPSSLSPSLITLTIVGGLTGRLNTQILCSSDRWNLYSTDPQS